MELRPWQLLPDEMRTKEVRKYYNILMKHRMWLEMKRVLDVIVAGIMLAVLIIPMGIIALAIRLDSPGPVFFRQARVTQYGRIFRIYKFRTMVDNASKLGAAVTVDNDSRITKVGAFLRKYRMDEFPQLFNILAGDMTLVGTRPEVPKYVKKYTKEMYATLLLPAGPSLIILRSSGEKKTKWTIPNNSLARRIGILSIAIPFGLFFFKCISIWKMIPFFSTTVSRWDSSYPNCIISRSFVPL